MRIVLLLYIVTAIVLNFVFPSLYTLLLAVPALLALLYLLRERRLVKKEEEPSSPTQDQNSI
jgi:uncharacterized membrane protein